MNVQQSAHAPRCAPMSGPDGTAEGKLAVMLDHAAWVVRSDFERPLKSRDLNWGRYCLLSTLHDAGECVITRLADLAHQQQPSTSRWLRELEKKGLTKRYTAKDRREIMVSLTPEGERTLRDLAAAAAMRERQAAVRFPALHSPEFLAALRSVAEAVHE